MAIARMFDGHGWTLAVYDELITRLVSQLGLAPGQPAPGVILHWAASTDDGIRAVDVYESRDAADRLAGDVIAPIVIALGAAMPEITEYEIHGLLHSPA